MSNPLNIQSYKIASSAIRRRGGNLKLPDKPGVYFFLKNGEILYIGKATSLKDRVKSYLGKDLIETRGPILVDMVFKADKIDWQETDSVLEALILEANLIKKYQPKYNTKEKSDKSFNYVCITKEKLPKVIIKRGKEIKNFTKQKFSQVLGKNPQTIQKSLFGKVFGPYPNSSQLREALKIVRRIFPFLDDKSKNYLEFYKQINLVPDLDDKKLYLQNIQNIKLFFEGKKKKVLKNLQKEMNAYSKLHEFEKAGEVKRQIFALKHINDVALIKNSPASHNSFSLRTAKQNSSLEKITRSGVFRIEAYDIAHMGGKNMVGVMTVVEDGEVAKSEYKKFKIRTQSDANDTGALKEVLERRLTHTEWPYPSLIVVDGGIAQINATKKVLANLKINIPIVSVLKDERHKPKAIMGEKNFGLKYEREILLANSEAHRFAIAYHKNMRNRNFLK
ncbi:MAG: GIY-YIG nuclease family protein [Candidatus Paceibacterota bacterium]|jgi:excinuclease ABC subunit C